MTGFFDKLNLQPHERRILVIVAVVLFGVLNSLFVWPRFGDWRKAETRFKKTRDTLAQCQEESTRLPRYEARLRQLEDEGSAVLPEDQARELIRAVQLEARKQNVTVNQCRPIAQGRSSETNLFFDEQTIYFDVTSDDKELVNLLVALTSDELMIRVRDLTLRPDNGRYKLNSNMTLVASYQRDGAKPTEQ